ncbi:MAG: hypothetical protein AT713_00760 [Caldivirga sp. JCHS_4]|jgi:hypothetical protein|nr:MAG: hypothetical protein AT713_00760 [Caldivirga sp. JCHS_4]
MTEVELERKLLEVMSPEYIEPLIKFLKLIRRLDELGILDAMSNLLSSDVVEDLVKTLMSTNFIKLLNNYEELLALSARLSEPRTKESIEKTLDLLNALSNTGLLDTLKDLLSDPEVLSEVSHTFINTNMIYLVTNIDTLLDFMTRIRCCAYVASLNAAMDVASDGRSIIKTISEMLKDEDARRGLNFLLLSAKYLGMQLKERGLEKQALSAST